MPSSLFTGQTPNVGNASDGTPGITRATTVQFSEDGQITHVRWWCPTTVTGTWTVAVWQVTAGDAGGSGAGTLLASKVHSGTPTGNAWNLTALDSAVPVVPGVLYRIGVHSNEGRYVASNSFFVTPLVNGSIIAEANNADPVGLGALRQGTFQINAALTYPQQVGVAASYFVDVVFVADSEGGDVSGTGAIVLPALDMAGTGTSETVGAPQEGAAYELEEVMDALAATFDGLTTGDSVRGVAQKIQCFAEIPEQISVPAVVLELDDLDWDQNMGDGADTWTILVTVLVQNQDSDTAQRELWRFLSRRNTSGVARLKGALKANQSLGGLVSYAHFARVRNASTIVKVNGIDYLAAELIIEVMS